MADEAVKTEEKKETAASSEATGLAAAASALLGKGDRSYRRLRRRELMELVQSQSARLAALEEQNRQLSEQLEKREVIITESGSIAEACMKMNGVFEAAQKACDQYMESASSASRRMKEETEKECASLRESVLQECVRLRERTWQDCVDLREKTRQDCADLRERILTACEKQLQGIMVMPDAADMPVMKELAFPKMEEVEAEEAPVKEEKSE